MSRIAVLANRPLMPLIMDQLEARFEVFRWTDIAPPDRAAFAAGDGKRIRGIAFGHAGDVVDAAMMDHFPSSKSSRISVSAMMRSIRKPPQRARFSSPTRPMCSPMRWPI